MKENHKRAIIKALSWRLSGTILTIILIFIFTRELVLSFSVGFVESVVKIMAYYLHERIWNRINWGKSK